MLAPVLMALPTVPTRLPNRARTPGACVGRVGGGGGGGALRVVLAVVVGRRVARRVTTVAGLVVVVVVVVVVVFFVDVFLVEVFFLVEVGFLSLSSFFSSCVLRVTFTSFRISSAASSFTICEAASFLRQFRFF